MDIDKFMATVQPGKKVSRLKQFEKEIRELKSKGYTDEQIRGWLAENNIQISREAVRQFVNKIIAKGESNKTETAAQPDTAVEITGETQAQKLQKRLAEQQRQASSTKFKHDKSGNN